MEFSMKILETFVKEIDTGKPRKGGYNFKENSELVFSRPQFGHKSFKKPSKNNLGRCGLIETINLISACNEVEGIYEELWCCR